MFWTYCDDARVHYFLPVRLGSEVCQLLINTHHYLLSVTDQNPRRMCSTFSKKWNLSSLSMTFWNLKVIVYKVKLKIKHIVTLWFITFGLLLQLRTNLPRAWICIILVVQVFTLTALKYQDHSALKFSEVCPTLAQMNTW